MSWMFRKPYFLGIDFGTSSVKMVELALEGDRVILVNYGQVTPASFDKKIPAPRAYDEEILLRLRALLKRFGPKSKVAYVAMPAFIGLISLIEFPEMSETELEEAIKFEAHKYIPSPLEEVALSWEIVGKRSRVQEGGGQKIEVLLVAALNKEVERYERYIEQAGLTMNLLELETFSLARAVIGKRTGLSIILDIGARATNLILVENSLVKVSRNLDVGGKDITKTLVESLGITNERAEILKKSGKDFLNNPESKLLFPALQMIGNEAKRMLSAYQSKHPEAQCESVVLSGGSGQFTGLPEYFSKYLDLPVRLGNPWERIQFDPKLSENIERMGTSFSVAIGLALSGVDIALEKKQKTGST